MNEQKTPSSNAAVPVKQKRERSPAFPFIALPAAIKRLMEFDEYSKRHPVPAKHSGKAWGMKGWTSQAQQTLAALKYYGFVEYRGSGASLEAILSTDGRTYLRAQQDSIKREVVKRAALKPKAFAKYFALWGTERPSNDICLDRLILKDGFNEATAKLFLNVYDATIAYASLADSDKTSVDEEDQNEDLDSTPNIDVGDLVKVEIDGQLMFPNPVRVRAIKHYEGKPWFYVEGSEAGVSMDQVQLHQKGELAGFVPPTLPLEQDGAKREGKLGWKEERLIDDSGEETFLSYKGEPTVERYEFIRDYLDFRIKRLQKK